MLVCIGWCFAGCVFGMVRVFLSWTNGIKKGVSPVGFRHGVEAVMGVNAVASQQGEVGGEVRLRTLRPGLNIFNG